MVILLKSKANYFALPLNPLAGHSTAISYFATGNAGRQRVARGGGHYLTGQLGCNLVKMFRSESSVVAFPLSFFECEGDVP